MREAKNCRHVYWDEFMYQRGVGRYSWDRGFWLLGEEEGCMIWILNGSMEK